MRPSAAIICFSLVLSVSAGLLAESSAGMRWTAPAGWKSEAARPMRAATYTVAAAPGDHDTAECGVYFFGPGQGGSIQANIDRWKGQFTDAAGKPAVARTAMKTIHGLPVTTIDVSGQYSGMGGPTGEAPVKNGYRLLGAIVTGPGGNVFVKFTGPAKTIAANQAKFDAMLASFDRQ